MTNLVTSPSPGAKRELGGELRDTEQLIRLWQEKAFKFGAPPPASVFDFSRMIGGGDWGYRFVISADPVSGDHAFLIYGLPLARLLELPEKPMPNVPIARQLPERYLPLFNAGCSKAIAQALPIRTSGAVVHGDQIELYRAAFMPLAGQAKSSLVFGSFNRRVGPRLRDADTVRNTYNWLGATSGRCIAEPRENSGGQN